MDHHTDLSTTLGLTLKQHDYRLALAESCTGGLVAAAVTDIAGSSAWFDCGFITYSNQAKQDMLSVPADILKAHGAVSEETAIAMAKGALSHSQANVAASITGIAGPSGGTAEKPVGTVCFAWAHQDGQCVSSTEYFTGDRLSIRQQAAAFAMRGILTHLLSA